MAKFEYNSIITANGFSTEDKFRKGSGAKLVCDVSGKIIGSASDKALYDLFGSVIARASDSYVVERGKKEVDVVEYADDASNYILEGDYLYDGNRTYLGRLVRRERNAAHITALSVAAVLLAITIALIAFIGLPESTEPTPPPGTDPPVNPPVTPPGPDFKPIVEVSDTNGKWEDQGAVAVFGSTLQPGSKGEYQFTLSNNNEGDVLYSFYLEPRYQGSANVKFPILFKLKMNNIYMETTDWQTVDKLTYSEIEIKKQSTQVFTLEWEWPFEGSDGNDTLIGVDGGTISMILHLTAQAR